MPLPTMIFTQIRKSFTYLFPRNTSSFVELHFASFFALHFFSTSTKNKGKRKDAVNSFLKECGLSDAQLQMFKPRSQLHFADLEKTIKPNIKVFHEFGFSNPEIAEIIARQPTILCCSVRNRIISAMHFLNDLLVSHDDMVKFLKKCGWFLISDVEKYVGPNIELLNSHGVPMERTLWLFRIYPRSLCITVETLRSYIGKLETLGIDPCSKMYTHALRLGGALTSDTWEQKIQVLRDLGFTETQISVMFKKAPFVFCACPEKLRKVTEMVLATEKYSNANIVNSASIFCCSIENRLKPRLELLERLDKLKLLWRWPCLAVVQTFSSKRFHKTFVAPYQKQLGEVYAVKSSSSKTKESLTTAASDSA